MDVIGKMGISQNRDSVSIWSIYMPVDVDRDEYIKTCFLTGTVTIINENGEIQHRVKIGKLGLQLIKFPEDKKKLGSQVICLSAPYSGQLYIVDVYTSSSEFNDQEEDQFRFYKKGIGFAEVRIDGRGRITLSVDSEEESDITISVTNKDRAGKLNLNVNGDILVQNDGTTTIKTTNNIHLEHNDGSEGEEPTYVEIIEDRVNIKSAKIYLNDSEEPILLGEKTATFLEDLLNQLGQESAGPYPLLGQTVYTQLKQRLEELKSTKSFVE